MSVEIRKPLAFKGDELKRGQTQRAIKEFLTRTCKDRYLLLRIVVDGAVRFRNIAGKAFRGFYVNDKMLDDIFGFLAREAGDNPKAQLRALERSELVALKLDRLKGLCRFIESERHLDEVLERNVPDNSEREAIRQQMLVIMRGGGVH